jgi:hypothetical protein
MPSGFWLHERRLLKFTPGENALDPTIAAGVTSKKGHVNDHVRDYLTSHLDTN